MAVPLSPAHQRHRRERREQRALLAGKVAVVMGDAVVINRGEDDGVTYGMTFAIGTAVTTVLDPDTQEQLGAVDQRPQVVVTYLRPRFCVCYPRTGPVGALVGDVATITLPPEPPPVPDIHVSAEVGSGDRPWWMVPLIALLAFGVIAFCIWQGLR